MKTKTRFNRILVLLLTLALALNIVPAYGATSKSSKKTGKQAVSIVYTNDIHGYIANDTSKGGLRLSNVSQMVKDMRKAGKHVVLADAGDSLQGATYAVIDKGVSMDKLMDAAGYQVVTAGNHDFDYTANALMKFAKNCKREFISCNLYKKTKKGKARCFDSRKTFKFGKTKVAFVGVTTPQSITDSTPSYYQDKNGNWVYFITGTKSAKDMYKRVQESVDAARKKADYVVLLAHVGFGNDEARAGIDVASLVKNTTGVDAVISGHSHDNVEQKIKNKKGKSVLVVQTKCYLGSCGVLTISKKGTITNEFVASYENSNAKVAALEDQMIQNVQDKLGQKVATLDTVLTINDADDPSKRIVRARETNGGDFAADALYWYLNEKAEKDCDIAIQNGGGIRCDIEAGDVTLNNLKNTQPFGNMVCVISASGQQIKDALEMGSQMVGEWNNEKDAPAEFGGFLHVAGMRYTIESATKSSVVIGENEMFVKVAGDYKVKDIEIYNRETGEYEPIDLDKQYNVGGINYILRNNGNGMTMFNGCKLVCDYLCEDATALAAYAVSFKSEDGYPRINTANSPLASLKGYLIDYENLRGSGRITVE